MAKTSTVMDDMIRKRRADMAAMPADASYTGPSSEPTNDSDTATETTEKFTVAPPGQKGTDNEFEYEPWLDTPGAWIVYPPGVPCDDTEYRIQMKDPAGPDDFAEMQKALDDAGAGNSESSPSDAAASDAGTSTTTGY